MTILWSRMEGSSCRWAPAELSDCRSLSWHPDPSPRSHPDTPADACRARPAACQHMPWHLSLAGKSSMHVLRLATRQPMLQVTPALGHTAPVCCSTLHRCVPLVSLQSSGLTWQALQLRHHRSALCNNSCSSVDPVGSPSANVSKYSFMTSLFHLSRSCVATAALLLGKSMVWAFDRDLKRLQRLRKNIAATGAHNVTAQKVRLSCTQDDLFLLPLLPAASMAHCFGLVLLSRGSKKHTPTELSASHRLP